MNGNLTVGPLRIRGEVVELSEGAALFVRDRVSVTGSATTDAEWMVDLDIWPIQASRLEFDDWAPITAIIIDAPEDSPPRLIPKKLASAALELIVVGREREGDALSVAERLVQMGAQLEILVALTPVYAAARHRAIDVVGTVTDGFPLEHVVALREMQAVAAGTFGSLEWDRAIAWFVEEVGELAQAQRQQHGAVRLHEELGQVFNWTLCLANISGVDVASAASGALAQEVARQRQKYGAPHPYRAGSST